MEFEEKISLKSLGILFLLCARNHGKIRIFFGVSVKSHGIFFLLSKSLKSWIFFF